MEDRFYPLLAPLALLILAISASAQTSPTTPPLESLDENRLLDELAGRGMVSLLDHYFAVNHVSSQMREEIGIVIALRDLDSDAFARKTPADRRKEMGQIVQRIDRVLPDAQDPQRLMRYATSLLVAGCQRPQDLLELWGENPRTQGELNPIAEVVDRTLARAAGLAQAKADAILAKITTADDEKIPEWNAAAELAQRVKWTQANADYGLALSYDRASPERTNVAVRAIGQLKKFDEAGSNVRIDAELAIAKLSMAMGGPEGFKQARDYFAKVITAANDPKSTGKYVLQSYQARYFSLVTDVLDKKPGNAQKGLAELKAWEDANLPSDSSTRLSMESARSMLEYRIDAALSAGATDPAAKAQYDAEAVNVLMELLAKRPDLRSIVSDQALSRMPDNPNLGQLDPLLLEALVTRGVEIVRRSEAPSKDDSRNTQIAADAAREIVRRKAQAGILEQQVDNAAYSIGVFEDRIGSTGATDLSPREREVNQQDAVEAFLNYVEHFGADHTRAEAAMDRAIFLAGELHRGGSSDERSIALYDRMLDVGFRKAGRVELASAFATRKKELGDFATAAKAYAAVKSDQPAETAKARYWQMFCDQQLLRKATPAQVGSIRVEVQHLADVVSALLPQVTDAKTKTVMQLIGARAMLIAADVARSSKEPSLALKRLEGFDARLTALPPSEQDELAGRAMFLRVNALVALNRDDEATNAVRGLISRDPQRAPSTIATILQELTDNYNHERGKDHPDSATLTVLAGERAQLSALLLEQVEKDPTLSPKTRREYLMFNAHSQVEASKLETDPTRRTRYLAEALKTYEALLKDVSETDQEYADLQRLIALAEFEIGDIDNVQKAHAILTDLFDAQKFGTPMTRVGDESQSNDLFWEGLLRLLQCKVKIAATKNEPALREQAVHILKNYIIQFGDRTGGETYAKDFRALRADLLGNWQPSQ